jgi:5-methylcytosine-specific restriction endonuclease McrA
MVYRDMKPVLSFATLSDKDLLDRAHRLADHEREATASLIACLAEVDARRLYLGEACSSLFAWCTDVLHLSGDAAYGRIEAARVVRRFPVVLDALAEGSVTMTAVALLRPYLTDANHRDLLARAHHKSKRQVEQLVAALAPKPDVPATTRRLPRSEALAANSACTTPKVLYEDPLLSGEPKTDRVGLSVAPTTLPSPVVMAATHRPVVAPLAPERFRIQFTVSDATHARLQRAQDLLRHAIPNGDPAAIFDRALIALIAQLEKQKWAASARPRARARAPKGRTIPAAVRRAVSRRDEGRCAFVGPRGRCAATAFLEFHHVIPYARGGEATEENIQLRCRAHNQYEAERAFDVRAAAFVKEASVPYGRRAA